MEETKKWKDEKNRSESLGYRGLSRRASFCIWRTNDVKDADKARSDSQALEEWFKTDLDLETRFDEIQRMHQRHFDESRATSSAYLT